MENSIEDTINPMKQTLYEDKLISEAIQEEMGISDEVDSLALLLSNTVLNNIKKIPRSKVAPGISTSTFKIPLKSGFGQGLVVKVINTFFGDKKIYAEYRLQTPKKANIYKKKDNTLEMHIDYINEMPNSENFYGAFYHELKHLFQDVKSFGQIKNRPNYHTSAWGIRHKNEAIRTISEIVYYGTDKELRAFTGQAYEGIMHMDVFNSPYSGVRDAIIDTKLYQGYLKLKDALRFLQQHKDEEFLKNVLDRFEVNYHQILEHCEWVIKEYARNIGRVIVKCEEDMMEKNLNEGAMVDF